MWKKGILAGLLILILGILVNWLISLVVPTLSLEFQNTAVFRPWADPLMMAYYLYPFILGVVLAYLWDLLGNKVKETGATKAFNFAKIYFIIATIPGMYISYTSMQISFVMILSWTVTGFLQAFVAGLVFTRVK